VLSGTDESDAVSKICPATGMWFIACFENLSLHSTDLAVPRASHQTIMSPVLQKQNQSESSESIYSVLWKEMIVWTCELVTK
jgi:hypothetical protein